MNNINSFFQMLSITGKWQNEFPNLMESLLNYTTKSFYRPLISEFYGDRNAWFDFFDMLNSKTLATFINIPKSIHLLLNFDIQRNVRYEDYNFKSHITTCDTIFTSTSIPEYNKIKLMEILTQDKKLLKDMWTSHIKKYRKIENINLPRKISRKWY